METNPDAMPHYDIDDEVREAARQRLKSLAAERDKARGWEAEMSGTIKAAIVEVYTAKILDVKAIAEATGWSPQRCYQILGENPPSQPATDGDTNGSA